MSPFCLVFLLCSQLVYTKQVPIEYGTIQDHSVTISTERTLMLDDHKADLLRTNVIETKHISTRQSVEKDTGPPKVKASYVRLPEDQIRCNIDDDCWVHNLPLRCGQDGLCECVGNLCWTYYTDASKWPVVNVFTCDACGSLGSSCNATSRCDEPGHCLSDGYCHCRNNGEHDEDGICWIANTNWAMMIACGAMGIILVFAVLVTAYNLYVTRPWRNGCRRRRATPDVLHHNGTDNDTVKTPAYTVRDYYGYSPVILPEDSIEPVQVDAEIANTSSSTAQVDEQTASTSSSVVEVDGQTSSAPSSTITVDYAIQENSHSEIETSVHEDSTGSTHLEVISGMDESLIDSSLRSSISSNASTVNSERPLVTSGHSSTHNGHSSGFSIGKVFNRGPMRRDDYSDSTRF